MKSIKELILKDNIEEARQKLDKRFPRVMIGIVTYEGKDYCFKEFLECLKSLTYPNFDIVIADTSPLPDTYYQKLKKKLKKATVLKSEFNSVDKRFNVRDGRNLLLKHFNQHPEYEYFFSLEIDNLPPKNVIETLLSEKKDVVGGWYNLKGNYPSISMVSPRLIDHVMFPDFKKISPVFRVFMMGLGCVLIHRSVFDKIGKFKILKVFPFGQEVNWYDDVFFYLECEGAQIKCYCIRDLQIPHIVLDEKGRKKVI